MSEVPSFGVADIHAVIAVACALCVLGISVLCCAGVDGMDEGGILQGFFLVAGIAVWTSLFGLVSRGSRLAPWVSGLGLLLLGLALLVGLGAV